MKAFIKKLAVITLIKPNEQKSAAAAFVMVFTLMAVYFILRPIRDAMASDWSDSEVSYLWNIQFFLSTGIVMLYCFAINRIRLKLIVPFVYAIFASSFMIFYVFIQGNDESVWVEKAFYLWVTSFSLLNISVFWTFMSEIFTQAQGKRLFPFIGAGASTGALLGPAVPTFFADAMGLSGLLLLAALGLCLVIPLILYLITTNQSSKPNSDNNLEIQHTMNGRWWSGFSDLFKNPLLMGIAGFILLYVFINSFIYFQQKNLLAEFSRVDRAQILGGIDWVVNLLTFVFALALTSRMVKSMGMAATLASVPLAMVLGFVVLAMAPMVVILLSIQITRRVGNYAITRPAREMLFTQVTQAERYKAKPVIDVVVYRGGDAVSASLYAAFSEGLGLTLVGLSLLGAFIAGIWATLGLMLGKRFDKTSIRCDPSISSNKPSTSKLNSTHFKIN